jgi:hypothetical protein
MGIRMFPLSYVADKDSFLLRYKHSEVFLNKKKRIQLLKNKSSLLNQPFYLTYNYSCLLQVDENGLLKFEKKNT